MAALVSEETPETFTFHHIKEASFVADTDLELKEQLSKWGLSQAMQLHTFRYDQYYQPHLFEQIAMDFLNDKEVQSVFKVNVKGSDERQPLGDVTKCKVAAIPATQKSFEFFDRLNESGIVQATGRIQPVFETYVDDLQVADKLRGLLVSEESEDFTLFDDDERDELLFRVFSHCVLGGGICQYEDTIQPYFEATKKLYKDFLAVRKNPETGKVEVLSQCLELQRLGFKSDGAPLFPTRSPYSFCYLLLNPTKRLATVWYSPWVSLWGN